MKQISHLAMKVPVSLGVLALVTGCYTVFSHPQSEVQIASDNQYSECGSCHAAGFASPILPEPYGYVSTPFQDFYATPWWLPGLPSSYGGGVSGAGTTSKKTVARDEEEGRHVGGRGAGLPSLPPNYDPPGTAASPTPPQATQPASGSGTTGTPGQQKGRTMKKPKDKEEPKDDSGG